MNKIDNYDNNLTDDINNNKTIEQILIYGNATIMNIKKIKDSLNIVGIDKLNKIIIRSDKEGIECGFGFCNNDNITTTKMCIGDECGVFLVNCGKDKRMIGSFHTHPREEDHPSGHDIKGSIINNEDFSCLGTMRTMKKEKKLKPIIRCYLTKNYDINNYIPTTVINTINEHEKNIKPINPATITDEELAERSAKSAKYNKAIILLSKATDKISRKMIRESNRNADLTIENKNS